MAILSLILIILVFSRIYQFSLRFLHILQLESYENERFISYVHRNRFYDFKTSILLLVCGVSDALLTFINKTSIQSFLSGLFSGLIFALLIFFVIKEKNPLKKEDVIKKLVLTDRAKRILISNIVLQLLLLIVFFILLNINPFKHPDPISSSKLFVLSMVLVLGNCYILFFSNFLTFYLWDKKEQSRYIKDAKRILSEINPIVIAITGSYGKTSTKHITNQLLSARLPVLVTQGSFNTDMGICKTIRESLESHHKYFIVEMGAYRIGSIKRLCNFTPPVIGILTSIGVSHLERFGTRENVLKGKRELIEALPQNGLAIINGDDDFCREAAKASKAPVRFFGLDKSKDHYAWASSPRYSQDGMIFNISINNVLLKDVTSPLLGEHNLMNILAGVVCADFLGIDHEVIRRSISSLEPIAHRMVISRDKNNITIIDDSYNSNPEGFKSALLVMQELVGRKILITPGIVELGDASDSIHVDLSEIISKTCDMVFIIENPHIVSLGIALKEKIKIPENLRFFPNLNSAKAELDKIISSGDIVLFENDLTDNYFSRR
jgi:UDP-N-acetylmuramoyl-tripeptide--D-alanyl-D-alanine ligase